MPDLIRILDSFDQYGYLRKTNSKENLTKEFIYRISANSFRGNYSFLNLALWTKSAETIQGLKLQRVLALCDFWDLEKFALAKNRNRHVSIANVRIN